MCRWVRNGAWRSDQTTRHHKDPERILNQVQHMVQDDLDVLKLLD
ncbi:MAG: hypothetical protein RLN83_01045 [Balneola sp.]